MLGEIPMEEDLATAALKKVRQRLYIIIIILNIYIIEYRIYI